MESAFSGNGARLFPGRWNSRGVPMVYTAESRALALLEILVHLESEEILQKNFVIFPVNIPDQAIVKLDDSLPNDWRDNPPPLSTRNIGDAWVKSGESLVLAVPSAIIPQEYNYLINPYHKDYQQLTIDEVQLLNVDKRLV